MGIFRHKWFEKAFFITSSLLFIWLFVGFITVGGFISLLFLAELDIWTIIQQRFWVLTFFAFLIAISILLLFSTWKNRATQPKTLTISMTILYTIILIGSFLAIIFLISFGYNA